MANSFLEQNFLFIVIVWMVFSFLFLWFLGGACLNPVNGTECIASGKLDFFRLLPVVGLLFPSNWSSLMYFLAPLCGFVLAFVLINWWNSYFETKEASGVLFLVLILLALFVGYYINLSFYMNEAAALNSRGGVTYSTYFCILETDSTTCNQTVSKINQEYIAQAKESNSQKVSQLIPIDYWGELRRSMYLLFILGSISAWMILFAREVYTKFASKE